MKKKCIKESASVAEDSHSKDTISSICLIPNTVFIKKVYLLLSVN